MDAVLGILIVVVGSVLTAAVLGLIRFLYKREKEFREDVQLGKQLRQAVDGLTEQISKTNDSLIVNGTSLGQAWSNHQRDHVELAESSTRRWAEHIEEAHRTRAAVQANTVAINDLRNVLQKRRWWLS